MRTSYALQVSPADDRWLIKEPVFEGSLAAALRRLRKLADALPSLAVRLVDAATLQVLAVSHPALRAGPGELQPTQPTPAGLQ